MLGIGDIYENENGVIINGILLWFKANSIRIASSKPRRMKKRWKISNHVSIVLFFLFPMGSLLSLPSHTTTNGIQPACRQHI